MYHDVKNVISWDKGKKIWLDLVLHNFNRLYSLVRFCFYINTNVYFVCWQKLIPVTWWIMGIKRRLSFIFKVFTFELEKLLRHYRSLICRLRVMIFNQAFTGAVSSCFLLVYVVSLSASDMQFEQTEIMKLALPLKTFPYLHLQNSCRYFGSLFIDIFIDTEASVFCHIINKKHWWHSATVRQDVFSCLHTVIYYRLCFHFGSWSVLNLHHSFPRYCCSGWS